MKLQVQYTAQLQSAAGRANEAVELPEGSTLAQLLDALAAAFDRDVAAHLVTAGGHPRPSLMIVLNDSVVPAQHVVRTVLKEGDTVVLLPPISGG